MSRLALLALACTAFASAQIAPPLIGHMRDRAGRVVPVYGIAGTFTLGRPVAEGALHASFGPGGRGLIQTGEGWVKIGPGGWEKLKNDPTKLLETRDGTWLQTEERTGSEPMCRRQTDPSEPATEPCPSQPLTLSDFTERLELPEPVTGFERMAAEWFVLRGDRALYAVRWPRHGEPQYWQLPESEEPQPQQAEAEPQP